MKTKCNSWLLALSSAAAGTLPGFFSSVPRGCNGICGSCGGGCIASIVLGLWVGGLYLFYRIRTAVRKMIRAGFAHEK